MSLLEVKNLSIGYSNGKSTKLIQKGINLQLDAGQIVSLMGQNGVGKTTFIKTISGLLPSLAGDVLYQGNNLKKISKGDMAKEMSVVLTEKPYSQNLSVLELIAIGRHPYSSWIGTLSNHDKEVIDWAITETHINYLADRKIYELSDGQLQKVMIARALAQETNIILLDEPAAHLDLYNKIEVMVLLRQIAQSGKAILISTHDMQISTQLSDQMWLFNFGEAVQQGTPEDLILNGKLRKALNLEDYGYDMIHGTVNLDQKEKTIYLEGEGERLFWTTQALKRNGYQTINTSENLPINCTRIKIEDITWQLTQENKSISCSTIHELLDALKNLHHQIK